MLASFAFRLQYAHARLDISLDEVRRPAGWFEKRVSWLRGFINVMGLSAEEVSAEVRGIYEQELVYDSIIAGCKMDLDFLVQGQPGTTQ